MATTTARDIITRAMKKAKILAATEVPTAGEIQDALDDLNDLISEWSINDNMTVSRIEENANTIAAVSSISIGSNQTWDTVRPHSISSAFIRDGVNDYSVEVVPRNIYENIGDKTITGRPDILYYDLGVTQQANQTGTIYLYPKTDLNYDLHIISNKNLTEFTSINANTTFPLYYKRALVYNLAVAITPDYLKSPDPLILQIAQESKKLIEALNAKNKQDIFRIGLPENYNRSNRDAFYQE